mmetsp:Transcript_1710/g.3544  ORF Transcript_1710/g.3544 Transcript_1710/m.3544 type:complete len:85 (+) Transcript_1710:1382-1636(+)
MVGSGMVGSRDGVSMREGALWFDGLARSGKRLMVGLSERVRVGERASERAGLEVLLSERVRIGSVGGVRAGSGGGLRVRGRVLI